MRHAGRHSVGYTTRGDSAHFHKRRTGEVYIRTDHASGLDLVRFQLLDNKYVVYVLQNQVNRQVSCVRLRNGSASGPQIVDLQTGASLYKERQRTSWRRAGEGSLPTGVGNSVISGELRDIKQRTGMQRLHVTCTPSRRP